MSLYERWLRLAYDQQGNIIKRAWNMYLPLEQSIYEDMLKNKKDIFKGTLAELASQYNIKIEYLVGFFDGINAALEKELDMAQLTEDSFIDVKLKSFEVLYKKMVEYKANHLTELEPWNDIFTAEQREIFYKEQKSAGTVIKGDKVGRNDPCPCGSGKKYKKCCASVA